MGVEADAVWNSAQAFQRLMDRVCRGLKFLFVYLDDILIACDNEAEHRVHLTALFERLQAHGLVINPSKWVFGRSSIEFLGHDINARGVIPLPGKVKVIQEFKRSVNNKGLQEFLGMVNFYHRFLPAAARVMKPLYAALTGQTRKLQEVVWSEAMIQAFARTKDLLVRAVLLAHPLHRTPTKISADASDVAFGAVLEQCIKGVWSPLSFYSKQLNSAERNYSTFDRDLLAIYQAVKHFRYFVEGRTFLVNTDHKPLIFAIAKVTDAWSGRQQRHLATISEYTTDIRHVAGSDNLVADALSRTSRY